MENVIRAALAVMLAVALVAAAAGQTARDVIPPSPPGIMDSITGPDSTCTGAENDFNVDVPLGCDCLWTVDGLPQTTTGCQLVYVFAFSGSYTIGVTIQCSGQPDTNLYHETQVTLTPEVDLGPDTAIHAGQVLVLDAGNPGSSYYWNTGDTTRTIEVSEAGTYGVTVTNQCGTDFDEITVSLITGTEDLSLENTTIRLISGALLIGNPGRVKATVMTSTGNIIYQGEAAGAIRLPGHGLYIVVLRKDQEFIARKVIY